MRVVKLGGSLFERAQYDVFACLAHIEKQKMPTVVVCGGGQFAENVRMAQEKWHFNDIAAHEMALLAMQQTAIMLQSFFPAFTLCASVYNCHATPLAIWSPDIAELNAGGVPASWDVTSDSLSAWLACQIQATSLQVIKACEVREGGALTTLVQQGVVDAQFVHFTQNATYDVTILNVEAFLRQ